MKKYIFILFISTSLFMVGCSESYTVPTEVVPSTDLKANTTIAELKSMISLGAVVPHYIADSCVIEGIVTADDEAGNIFKALYLQDSTGAIQLSINQADIYNYFSIGTDLFINCTGMYVGDYKGLPQLGIKNAGNALDRYDFANERNYQRFFANGYPDTAKIPVPEIFSSASYTSSDLCKLVTLKNVTFPDADGKTTFAEAGASIDRTAFFADSTTINVRTSGYCNFYADVLPQGVGDLTGILAIYNGTYQFYIRDRNDIGTFAKKK